MKHIALSLLAVAGFGPCSSREKPTPDTAAKQPTLAPHVGKRPGSTEAGYIGVLVPREAVEVTAPFTTRVEKLYVKLGDSVNKGDTLASLDPKQIQRDITVAKAAYRTASVAAGAAAAKYKQDLDGLKAGVVSQAEATAAQYDASKAGAAADQERARIQQLEARLKDLTIVSPISGNIALRHVDDGASVTEGQLMIRVISSGRPFVKFAVPAKDSRKIALGGAIEVRLEGRATTVPGVIKQVSPELDPVAQMTIAEADLTDPPSDLQSGATCHVIAKDTPKAN